MLSSWPAGGTKSLNMTLVFRDSIETPPADTNAEIGMASTKSVSAADVKDSGPGVECKMMLRTLWPPPPMSGFSISVFTGDRSGNSRES